MTVQAENTGAGNETVGQVEKPTSEAKPGNDWVDTLESGTAEKAGEQAGKTEGKDQLDGLFAEDKKATDAPAESKEKPKQEGESGEALLPKSPEPPKQHRFHAMLACSGPELARAASSQETNKSTRQMLSLERVTRLGEVA